MIDERSPAWWCVTTAAFAALLLLAGCCCGGGGASAKDLESMQNHLDAVDAASEEMKLVLLAAGFEALATEGGWRVGTCAVGWGAWTAASAEQKQVLLVDALPGCKSMCPSNKGEKETIMAALARASADQKTSLLVSACDEAGPEPVFTGDQERKRAQMPMDGYWIFRSAFDETFQKLDRTSGDQAAELKARYEATVPWVADSLALHMPPLDDDLEVPETTSRKPPSAAPTVVVGWTGIRVDGVEVVALVDEKKVAKEHKQGQRITPLYDLLVARADEVIAEREAREAAYELPVPQEDEEPAEGPAARTEEGKVGKKDAKLKRAKGSKVELAKATMDRQIAESAGILADLNLMEGGIGGIMGSRGTGIRLDGVESTRDAGRILLQIDRELPFALVRAVAHTAGEAGFHELQLGAINPDQYRQSSVDVAYGYWRWNTVEADEIDDKPPLGLAIVIRQDGYFLTGNAAILYTDVDPDDREPTLPMGAEGYPYESLTDLLVKVKAEYPDEQNVTVAPEANVPYEVVIATLDAARDHLPDGWEEPEVLFPYAAMASAEDVVRVLREEREARGRRGRSDRDDGYGRGGSRRSGTPGMSMGDMIILGALDRSVIKKVIKQHFAQIRYCYQKELNKDSSLEGKVVVKFVIAKDGTVSSAKIWSSTMDNSRVENCIAQRFMRFEFPQPKGGGIVIVRIPFTFSN